jgi:hypothetical protein
MFEVRFLGLAQEGVVVTVLEHAFLIEQAEEGHLAIEELNDLLVIGETEHGQVLLQSVIDKLLLLAFEHVVDVQLLEPFIGVVDAQLLE